MRTQLFLLATLTTAAAHANQVCHTVTFPSAPATWSTAAVIPRFDPALGTLYSIDATVTCTMTGQCGVENLGSTAIQAPSIAALDLTVRQGLQPILVRAVAAVPFLDDLAPFDGAVDYQGSSGESHPGLNQTAVGTHSITYYQVVSQFIGPAGNPGTLSLDLQCQDAFEHSGSFQISAMHSLQGDGVLQICYNFFPPGGPFCVGDGFQGVCPCGNVTPVGSGQGCRNSFGSGALLDVTGAPSISNDSLGLVCSGMPPATTVLFFQGTNQINNGHGIAFGDGVRCVGGNVVRLSHKTAGPDGTAAYPKAGDAPISVVGGVTVNALLLYQAWYRNAAAFCTPGTFNTSPGRPVTWAP